MVDVTNNPIEVNITQDGSNNLQVNNRTNSIRIEDKSKKVNLIPEIKEVSVLNDINDVSVINDSTNFSLVNSTVAIDVISNPVFLPFMVISDGEINLSGISTLSFRGVVLTRESNDTAVITIESGGGSGGSGTGGDLNTYYLNRANHVGVQDVSTITGLATVATTGSWNNLINRPTLGTAAALDAGTQANQVLLLQENNKLPALDGSLLTNIASPLTSKGDLLGHNGTAPARIPIGTNGQVLVADSTAPTGLVWVDYSPSTGNADTLENQPGSYYLNRANHTGTLTPSDITGLGTASLVDTGTLAGNVVTLVENNKLPALDGSLLTGIQSSFITTDVNSAITLAQTKNRIVFINSSSGAFNITLPVNPQDGDKIIFVDHAGSDINTPTGLGVNAVTLLANIGHNIQGYSSVTLDDENTTIALVFNSGRWSIYHASY